MCVQLSDYIATASKYGALIIEEQFVKEEDKTLRLKNLGGTAGGDKFITRGILFKLARDFDMGGGHWLYGGHM